MINRGVSKLAQQFLDRSIDASPKRATKMFQRGFLGVFGNRTTFRIIQASYRRQWLNALRRPNRGRQKILVIVDVCIGDAVLWAQCLPLLSERFPSAEIHYLCNKTGGELIEHNPNGIVVHNLFEGRRGFLSPGDHDRLQALLQRESYSLVLNFSPFLSRRTIRRHVPTATVIQLILPYTSYTIRAWKLGRDRHVSLLARRFIAQYFGIDGSADREASLNTNAVYLTRDNLSRAAQFLSASGIDSSSDGETSSGKSLVFLNPDATSQYGRIPFDIQSKLLSDLTNFSGVVVLLGQAYSDAGVEQRLLSTLPDSARNRIVLVPPMPIGAYTALIDRCDLFISGDTGPLHIASCRKVALDYERPMRNRTAIIAIYGATDSRMYGYDSAAPFHAPANQDAPSRSFSGPTPCRNITCINKFGKFCATVRCFDGLQIPNISGYIGSYLQQLPTVVDRSTAQSDRSPLIEITIPSERAHAL